jgi:membrane protease YdiL (CAAX protease family)
MNNMHQQRSTGRTILYIILFLAVFIAAQYVFVSLASLVAGWLGGTAQAAGGGAAQDDATTYVLIAGLVLASAFTLGLFVRLKWAPVSPHWLRTRQWSVLVWAALLALGTILPSEWILEQMQFAMPQSQVELFEKIMGVPLGYLAVGVFASLVEELVFRGAILRLLLERFGRRLHWVAIAISAALFGLLHGNLPQFTHAFLIGLLLGWMYYRTGSILPGVVFHWVNNTVAFVMFNLMPQMADGKLIDLFHGDTRTMWMGLLFSLCILLPSLFQLWQRMRPAEKE